MHQILHVQEQGSQQDRLYFKHQPQVGSQATPLSDTATVSEVPTTPPCFRIHQNDSQNLEKCYTYNYHSTVKDTNEHPDGKTHRAGS